MPFDYEGTIARYKSLAGKKDPKSLTERTVLARGIQDYLKQSKAAGVKPGANSRGPGVVPNIGASTTPPPPAAAVDPAATSPAAVPGGTPPATTEGAYSETPDIIPQGVWDNLINGLNSSSSWAPGVQLPSAQQLQDIYAKAYNQQLADLSYGVGAKQQQAQKSREQYLADRGISLDSAAYRNDQQSMADARAAEDAQLRAQAAGFAQTRADSEYNRAIQTAGLEMDRARLEQDLKYRGIEALSPLITAQAGIKSNEKISQAQLDSSDRQFFAGLSQDDRQFAASLGYNYAELAFRASDAAANRGLTKETFYAQLKQDWKIANDNKKLRTKELYEVIRNNKALTQLEKDKLVELTRSNKQSEAIAMIAAKKSGGSNPSLDDVYNRIVAAGEANAYLAQKYPELYGPNANRGEGGYSVSGG